MEIILHKYNALEYQNIKTIKTNLQIYFLMQLIEHL